MLWGKKKSNINTEIERKFLISGSFKEYSIGKMHITQGYLSSLPERTVRIRCTDKKGFITVKGNSDETGMKRFEWEKEIKYAEAEALLKLCEPGIIEKYRYIIEYKEHIFEVDEFMGHNKGLLLAEVELDSTNENIELPKWIGKEVTQDHRYYNSWLSKHPFNSWEE